MKRKIAVFFLLCMATLLHGVATAQSLSIFAKQKVVIWEILDRNDRPLDEGFKRLILSSIRDNFVASSDYEVYDVNTVEIEQELRRNGEATSFANICSRIGEKADFIIFTDITATASAFGTQHVDIIISSSLYRIKTAAKIATEFIKTQATEQSIKSGIASLMSTLFGVNMEGQPKQSSTQSTSHQPAQSSSQQPTQSQTPQKSTSTTTPKLSYEEIDQLYRTGCSLQKLSRHGEAIPYLKRAAEHGNRLAQYNLGYCYYHGRGVLRDYYEAVKWFRKSAEQGYSNAQSYLGYCYKIGRGVPRNYSEAVKWYRKAAAQGHRDAQEALRKM